MNLIWLIPLLPGAGALVNGLAGVRYFSRRVSGAVACATMIAALGLSIFAFWQLLGLPAGGEAAREHYVEIAQWIPSLPLQLRGGAIGRFAVPWGFRLDPLSAMMILVVTGIGTLIHIYSTAYMAGEPRGGVARFFCYLNLFCFFMLVLVLGSNFLVMFVGWEGVGLCSYLLIGYWYEKKSAADAGKKAFIMNRIGDWGFILGVLLVFYTFGTLDFRAVADQAATMPIEDGRFGVLSFIALALFIGATGKSAQIPLYVWLPDAMEGPTPVSALIHAATMVTAGVYMLGRNAVLFHQAPLVMAIVAIVGVLTAFMAASIGLVQYDIKRVLAYSTVSQLGYMFTAMGVGAFAAGAFHLMTHAFFKALLFLGSGSVIHAMAGEQDMRRMGGLKRYLPVTCATMTIGTLAISGIPPFSGFFSKDEILFRAYAAHRAIWAIAVITALMTAFYMFRLMSMTFFGAYNGPAWEPRAERAKDIRPAAHGPAEPHDQAGGHGPWHGPHESPSAMTVTLLALALGAIVAGFVGVPAAFWGGNVIEHFLEPSFSASGLVAEVVPHASQTMEWVLTGFSVMIALVGIWMAWKLYVTSPEISERLASEWPGMHRTLLNKYYVDELYGATVVDTTFASARGLWAFDRNVVDGAVNGSSWVTLISSWLSGLFDRSFVDGLVNLVGRICEEGSFWFRRLQTGIVQNYALLMLFGIFAFVSLYLFFR